MSILGKMIPGCIKRRLRRALGAETRIPLDKLTNEIAERKFAGLCAGAEAHARYSGKVILVTGATGFIGKEIARRFARMGAIVYAGVRDAEKGEALLSEFREEGLALKYALFDLADEEGIRASVEYIVSESGSLYALVNCAGGSARDQWNYICDQQADVIDMILDTNLRGSILCAKWAAREMMRQGSGRIINISSTVGVGGKSGFSDYAAAKAGVIGFTRSLALELGTHGITVNCVSPGIVFRGELSPGKLNEITAKNAMGSVGIANDIAYAVEFLASSEAGFITGQNIVVDGGRSLGLKGD